ncbi:MAG: hypothetical protein V1806_01020 [Pseudomonadota bacterium]
MRRLRQTAFWALLLAAGLALHLSCYPALMRLVVAPELDYTRHQFKVFHFDLLSLGVQPFFEDHSSGEFQSRRNFSTLRALAGWRVTKAGKYLIQLTCDDFGRVALDGKTVLTQEKGLDAGRVSWLAIRLEPGIHLLDLELTNWTGHGHMELLARAPGEEGLRPLGPDDLVYINLSNINVWVKACDWARSLGWLLFGWGLLACLWTLLPLAQREGLAQWWRRSMAGAVDLCHQHLFLASLLVMALGYFIYYSLGIGRFTLQIRVDGFSWYAFLPAYISWLDPTMASLLDPAKFHGYMPWDAQSMGVPHNTLFAMPTGYHINQCPIGVSLLMLPFFLVGHYLAVLLHQQADGFSFYYQYVSGLAALFYTALGLCFLKKYLDPRYPPATVLMTLACLLLGTNLYNYAVSDVAMSHAYAFFLISAFLWRLERWNQEPRRANSLWLGVVVGLLALTRTQDLSVLLLLPLGGLWAERGLGQQMKCLWSRRLDLALLAATGLAVFSPQLLVWKISTGQWFFNSLSLQTHQPAVDLLSPHLWLVLLSVQRGVITWFPLILTALAGLLVAPGQLRRRLWPPLLITAGMLYAFSCFWDPTFGFAYGLRVLVDFLPLLALPMAAFWQWVGQRRRWVRRSLMLAGQSLLAVNLSHVHAFWTGELSGHAEAVNLETLYMLWAG